MTVLGVLQRGEALLERGSRRVRDARVVVALVHADRLLRERGGLVDRRRQRARRRVGLLAGMDRARLELHRAHRSPGSAHDPLEPDHAPQAIEGALEGVVEGARVADSRLAVERPNDEVTARPLGLQIRTADDPVAPEEG